MKIRISIALVVAVCILGSIFTCPVIAQNQMLPAENVTADEKVDAAVTQWVNENYGNYYYIKNINIAVERNYITEKNISKEKLIVTFEKMLKVNSAENLPYVQGLRQGALSKNYQQKDAQYLDNYIYSLNEYIGVYTNTCIDIVAEYSKNAVASPVTLYYQDVYTTTIYPIDVLNISESRMIANGCIC